MFSSRYRLWAALMILVGLCGCWDAPIQTAQPQPQTEPEQQPVLPEESLTVSQTASTEPEPQADWANWRGPEFDGISRQRNWQTNWSSPPPIAWTKQIGIGYSAVSVADGKLVTLGHPRGTGQETIWCLDAKTGEQLWSVSYDCDLLNHLHKGGPGSTPTIVGQFVYVNSREGEVRKLNMQTGEVVWICSLPKELSIDLPEWGFTGSAVVYKDMVLFEAGSVVAIDQATGELRWKSMPRMPGYGTPERFTFEETEYLAALNNEGLSVINLEQQQEVTFFEWDSPYHTNSTTPIWHRESLFVSTGYNIGCGVIGFDGVSLSPRWQNKQMRNHMNTCVLRGGFLYGFDGNSHIRRTVMLKCIDWETGQLRWSTRGMGCGAVAATEDFLLITSDDGELILADLDPDAYRERGRVRVMDEQCWTVPVLCNGLIYCRGAEGTLACVDVRKSGEQNTVSLTP